LRSRRREAREQLGELRVRGERAAVRRHLPQAGANIIVLVLAHKDIIGEQPLLRDFAGR
jgi:hypothetical protein